METWHKVLIGLGAAGTAYGAWKLFKPADVEQTFTPSEVALGEYASRTSSRTVPSKQGVSLVPMATVRVKLKEPKFVINFDPGGTGKHGSSWDKSGRLRKMYDPGDEVSLSKAEKLLKNSTKGMLYAHRRVIVSTPQQFAQGVVNVDDPGGIVTNELPEWGDTIKLTLPAGVYMLSPEMWPYRHHDWKFFTKYWAWTSRGPYDLADPKAPDQPKLAIEAVQKFLVDDCTKWFTYVRISLIGMVAQSAKAVQLKAGSNGTITLQPYVSFRIEKWKKKESGSIAYNAWCETTSLAVKAAMVASGGSIGALAALFLKGAGIFAK